MIGATVGLARVGGWGSNSSGDIFIAFSTAATIPRATTHDKFVPLTCQSTQLLEENTINALFEAVADSVEEAIYNVLCMAEDQIGPLGRETKALPLDTLRRLMDKYYVDVPYV